MTKIDDLLTKMEIFENHIRPHRLTKANIVFKDPQKLRDAADALKEARELIVQLRKFHDERIP